MRTEELFAYTQKRWDILQRRNAGECPPWTNDPILAQYRFCNVYREDDKVTRWVNQHLRIPLAESERLVPAMVAARLINRISTLEIVAPLIVAEGWSEKCVKEIRHLKPVVSGAYMIKTPTGLVKAAGVDWILRRIRPENPAKYATLGELHEKLNAYAFIGSFLSAQVIADVKFVGEWRKKPDFWSFASSGPGSRRGLNRVFGRGPDEAMSEETWYADLCNLDVAMTPLIKAANMPRLSLQDLQNNLCEFDKYERTRLGEGRPKQKYNAVRA